MSIIDKLASSIGVRNTEPNKDLAQLIVVKNVEKVIKKLSK